MIGSAEDFRTWSEWNYMSGSQRVGAALLRLKNVTTFSRYKSPIHESIFIIFVKLIDYVHQTGPSREHRNGA